MKHIDPAGDEPIRRSARPGRPRPPDARPPRSPGWRAARAALAGVATAAIVLGLFVAEKRRPLRRATQPEPVRTLRNAVLGATSLAAVALVQTPFVAPLTDRVARSRIGLAQRLPLPAWARDAAAFLLLDYTIYAWHVLTHRVPWLWRFHVVHHIDLDMDTTTALRFHALDMALSAPWRAAQIVACGASPRAFALWQRFFFVSVVFHHANLRLPLALERRLVRVFTTPRMHGIHHSMVPQETGSNWSSGLSVWDWLHGTARVDVPQDCITIGVPAYADAASQRLGTALVLPFRRQPDAWVDASGRRPERVPLLPTTLLPG